MASDAYMEISDPNVWGEAYDARYGMADRALGAFEIFSFEWSANTTRKKESEALQPAHSNQPQKVQLANGQFAYVQGSPTSQTAVSDKKKSVVVNTFTIKKFIDKSSADLLLALCKSGLDDAKPMEWAVVSFRESGGEIPELGQKREPYMVLEFRKVWVNSLSWSVTPGADASGASQEEQVTFEFESFLVKYARQEDIGTHEVVKIRGFNVAYPEKEVKELSWDRSELEADDD